ncbi:MAG: ATP-binding protein [Lachnospiraceae bacterium]|nr:ATP-binding protein [Lachnospiraceae bacterium]
MQTICSKLLYYYPGDDSILVRLADALADAEEMPENSAKCNEIRKRINAEILKIIALSDKYGMGGSLWHNYLTYELISSQNPFTLAHERRSDFSDSMTDTAARDLALYRNLFHYDLSRIGTALGTGEAIMLSDFRMPRHGEKSSKYSIGDKICTMATELAAAQSDDEFRSILFRFYTEDGIGEHALNRCFKLTVTGEEYSIEPVYNTHVITLDDLVGYQLQKDALVKNTEAFVQGRPANNVLLYGDAGSGKSTSIQAITNMYFDRGLRLIEIHKDQFRFLPKLIQEIKERNYNFIIFIDDLSFEDNETEYKYLKAVIEGGAVVRPKNVLIYATSNRRHLVKETWKDRSDMEFENDLHHSDTMEEKLSLASRFGVAIHFPSPNRREYHNIVLTLAEKAGIEMDEEELLKKADAWEIKHGGATGRAAKQFIDYLSGDS